MSKPVSISLPQLIRDLGEFEPPSLPERMKWSASSAKLFKKCKRKFFWRYVMGLRPRYKAPALVIGSAFHSGIGDWYKNKRSSMSKIAERIADATVEGSFEGESVSAADFDGMRIDLQTLAGMMCGYGALHECDRSDWKVQAVEQEFTVDLGEFDFAGKIDLVATDKKGTFVVEHKTAKKIPDSYIERLPMDMQVRAYIFGTHRGLGISSCSEVLYNVVRKCNLRRKSNETADAFCHRIELDYASRPGFYFFRERLKFKPKETVAVFEYELRQVHDEYMAMAKAGMWNDPRRWMPNDATCQEYYRTCEYFGLCTNGMDSSSSVMYTQKSRVEIDEEPEVESAD